MGPTEIFVQRKGPDECGFRVEKKERALKMFEALRPLSVAITVTASAIESSRAPYFFSLRRSASSLSCPERSIFCFRLVLNLPVNKPAPRTDQGVIVRPNPVCHREEFSFRRALDQAIFNLHATNGVQRYSAASVFITHRRKTLLRHPVFVLAPKLRSNLRTNHGVLFSPRSVGQKRSPYFPHPSSTLTLFLQCGPGLLIERPDRLPL
jgi:hypothetical protein